MDDPEDARRLRLRVRTGAVVVLVLAGLGCAILAWSLSRPTPTSDIQRGDTAATANPLESASIFVHVLGAVQRPGLYELRHGARAVDAVAAAGGFLDTADQSQLNLARFVVDGEQLAVPAVGEAPVAAPGITAGGLVNLNTADAAALETLPRVGPAMAARIIAWRDANGLFASVEDLLNVSGIGDRTFEGLKALVTV